MEGERTKVRTRMKSRGRLLSVVERALGFGSRMIWWKTMTVPAPVAFDDAGGKVAAAVVGGSEREHVMSGRRGSG